MLKGEGKMACRLRASTGPLFWQLTYSDDHLRQQDINLIAAAWPFLVNSTQLIHSKQVSQL